MEIFKLFGSIFVDNEKANKSIAKTDKHAQSLATKFSKGVKTAAKWGAAIGTGAAVAGGALMAVANKAAATTDRIDKLSQRLGMSRQGFQEWEFVLSQSGSSMESLQSGMKVMVQRMADLENGTGKGAEAFGKLGIQYADIKNLSQEDIFKLTVQRFNEMEDGAEKAALAQDLFSRSGQDLLPLLNANVGAVDEMTKKAHDLGLVMSNEAIDAGVKYTDTMDKLKRSFGTVFTVIGTAVMPIMQKFSEWIIVNMPTIQKVFGTVFGAIETYIKIVINIVKVVKSTVENWLQGNSEKLEWFKEKFLEFYEWLKETFDLIIDIVQKSLVLIKAFWEEHGETIIAVAKNIWDIITTVIQTAMDIIQSIFRAFSALLSGDWETFWKEIKNILVSVWNMILEIVPELLDSLFKMFIVSFDVLKDIGKHMFEGLWEGMKGVWSSISNWVSNKVSWLKDKLAFWKKGKSKISNDPNSLPAYANGTNFHPGGWALVGERGPEIINMPRGSQVIPNVKFSGETDYKRLLAELADGVYNAIIDASKHTGNQEVKLEVDGKTLARILMPNLISENQRLGVSTA